METSDEIIQLGGPHHRVCACGCEIEFYGRRNQKYFNIQHKSMVNNGKRDDRNSFFKPYFDEMIASYKALQKGVQKTDNNDWVLILELTKYGFNPDCASQEVTDNRGESYYRLFDLVFRLSEDKNHVQIFKYK